MQTAQGNSGTLLSGLNNTAVGQGADLYRGEGGLATAGEYHNALEPFLGPPTKAIDYDPSHGFPHEAWFLPDAYQGRNEYVRETIVQTVVNYNSFMTSDILPWRQQNNPNIAWDRVQFDKTLIDMEPEQGIPRYVTVERETHTDYMVRRGLALIVNHGFASTPGGQKDFMYKVATIAGAVQETCDQSGLVAILRAKNEYRGHIVNAIRNAGDAYDMFAHELWRFGIVQHSERGWYHMDAEAGNVMEMENISPDTWIVPNRMTTFAAMGQHAETEVYRAGESVARANLEQGKARFTTFRGKSVYETRPYQLDVDGRIVDPLNRTRMIGDFFVLPYYDLRTGNDNSSLYPVGAQGTTQVYCCESDRFEAFCWSDVHQDSEFGAVSQQLFDQYSGQLHGMSFSDIEHHESGHGKDHGLDARSTMVGMMRAIAVHSALLKGNTDAVQQMVGVIGQPNAQHNSERHGGVWNEYLPPFLEGYGVQYGAEDARAPDGVGINDDARAAMDRRRRARTDECHTNSGGPSRHHLVAPGMPSAAQSRFSGATVAAISESVKQCIAAAHGCDPDSHTHAAATWAAHTSQHGYDDAVAHSATISALEDAMVEALKVRGGEDLSGLDQFHTDDQGRQRSVQDVAGDFTGMFRPTEGADAPWNEVVEKAQEAAPWHAQDAMVRSGEMGSMHGKRTEKADESMLYDAVHPEGKVFEAHYNISELKAGHTGTIYLSQDGWVDEDSKNNLRVQVLKGGKWEDSACIWIKGGDASIFSIQANALKAHYEPDKLRFTLGHKHNFSKYRPGDSYGPDGKHLDDLSGAPAHGGYDLLCMRPFRQYTMGTGVLLKKGSELGNTFRGWADFQLTDNIIAKTHIGHFTFWHASIVTNPKCLFLAEDIFCTNYVSGEGKKVLSWRHIDEFNQDPLGTMAKYDASIIALPVPIGAMNPTDHRLNLNNPISLTGVLDPGLRQMTGRSRAACVNIGDYEVQGKSRRVVSELADMWDKEHGIAPPNVGPVHGARVAAAANPRPYANPARDRDLSGQTYSDMYAALFGFHSMNHDVDYENSKTFETASRLINTMCFHTMQKFRNPLNNRWEVTNLNTGHFGENGIYEGVKKIRSGYLDYFKEMDYQKSMAMGGLTI
jgi:hypothetical protein